MNNLVKYDPLLFKCPKGTLAKGNIASFKVEVDETVQPKNVYFMFKEDADEGYQEHEMQKVDGGYEIAVKFEYAGHFWYNFKFVFNDYQMFLSKTYDNYSVCCYHEKGEDFLQLVTNKPYTCTDSMQGGLIYQIFVDRFCKEGEVKVREPLIMRDDWCGDIQKNTKDPLVINREVFGGNFKGVMSKLDYLKELGVTTIYLNPIGMANSNHKYDTADYMRVDPMFGSESEFKELVDKAKEHGMQIVFDGVYNHTGSDSIYFNKYGRFDTLGAYKSKESRFYHWFNFQEYPDNYLSWWGIDTLPSIKGNCTDFHDYIAGENGVLDKFLKLGVAGVRLDVVDEISDEFTKKISDRVKKYGDNKVIMGEVWEDAATKIAYSNRRKYFVNNELNSVMNYPVKESILSFIKTKEPFDLISTFRMLENNYPKVVIDNLMNFLGTHDTNRIFAELKNIADGDVEKAKKFMKIASLLTYTLPGVPSIFYGDEYGMDNNDGSSRGCFDWNNYQNEIYEWYMSLSALRKFRAMKDGEFEILYSKHGKFVFERTSENERIIVLVNMKSSPLKVELDGDYTSYFSKEKISSFLLKEFETQVLIEN